MKPTIIKQKLWEAKLPEEWELCQYCKGEGLVECSECEHPTKLCKYCNGSGETKKASGYYKAIKSDQAKYRKLCEIMGASLTAEAQSENE